jgi:hypothetical protein
MPRAVAIGRVRRLDFIGAYEQRRSTGGWRQPTGLYLHDPLDGLTAGLSAEDSSVLYALMAGGVGQERLEFLGYAYLGRLGVGRSLDFPDDEQ